MVRNPSFRRLMSAQSLESRVTPASFVVTTTADSGAGSLREAITNANKAADLDTITFNIGTGANRHDR